MATGEGKSLTACLPSVLAAWSGRPFHFVTVNDYLAERDAVESWLRNGGSARAVLLDGQTVVIAGLIGQTETVGETGVPVLMDIHLPGMDGIEVLREMMRIDADLPVIMVTAYGDDERRRKAAEFGAKEFVTKPVDFNFLKQQLLQLVTQSA